MQFGRMLRARGVGMTLAAVAALSCPVAAANAQAIGVRPMHAGAHLGVRSDVAFAKDGFKIGMVGGVGSNATTKGFKKSG